MLPLICLDVDGTLIGESGEPTATVWAAAERAIERGQHMALSTARGAFGPTWDIARRLDPDGWHVFHAGAAVVHTGSGQVIETPVGEDIVELADTLADAHGWVAEHYAARAYAVESDHRLAVDHAALIGVPFEIRPRSGLVGRIVRSQLVTPLVDVDVVLSTVRDAAEVNVTAATSPVMPDAAFVSITAQGISKATAIDFIAAELSIPLDAVMMVGDGHNDLEAIRAVGHGTAMGNAEPAVKAEARHHVAAVADDGVAEALDLAARLG